MSRRLQSLLLVVVAGTAGASTTTATPLSSVATSTITTPAPRSSATVFQPGGAPVLSINAHGRSILGSDGRLFIRTDAPGSLDIVGVAPTGNSNSDPGSFLLVASKNALGWDAAPLVPPGPALLSEWHWQTGASSLIVALSYLSSDGSTSPTTVQTVVAVSDRPAVHIEQILGQSNTTTAGLVWTETDGIGPGIVDRQILREQAPVTTQGCGEWTKGDVTGISGGEVHSTPSAPALAVTVAAAPGGRDGPVAPVRVLPITDLTLGHCYRFTLFVTDALGLVGQATSPAYVSGLLDSDGQPLPAWTGKVDIFRDSAFAPQQTWTWCVAASTQMMVNLIRGTSDRSYDGQLNLLNYARDTDRLPDSDAGAGLVGWRGALDKFSGTPYEVVTARSLQGAINLAAQRIRLTNRPVGLAVHDTTHAWVMTGFEATADPAFDPAFTVTAVYVSGPLYPREQSHGYDMAPDARLLVSDLGRYFTPVSWNGRLTWKFVAPLR